MLSELPEWLLGKYIDSLMELVDHAQYWDVTLTPEEIYMKEGGHLARNIMIDTVV